MKNQLVSAEVLEVEEKMRTDPYATLISDGAIFLVCYTTHARKTYPQLEFSQVPDDALEAYRKWLAPILDP